MKIATRQYARKQKRWIVSRFLKRRGGNVPPVYAVDGSDKSRWKEEVFVPACEILKHYIEGTESPYQPLPTEESNYEPAYNKCDICNVVTLTVREWQVHIKGRRHRKSVARHKREQLKAEMNDSSKTLK
ncbi:hypothetical protein LSH36_68g01023 [Paralvinella palmiformis]|uniref:U1-type domain-containing protein n=1 Tax=Paralvinella palmiformis TaxID=53620 RepID=A0AAD9K396_9ANNE|nr:hypothetical protein LSH36_68g01023 [Paralvinella palmiformis]